MQIADEVQREMMGGYLFILRAAISLFTRGFIGALRAKMAKDDIDEKAGHGLHYASTASLRP